MVGQRILVPYVGVRLSRPQPLLLHLPWPLPPACSTSPGPLTVSYRYHNATESDEALTGWNMAIVDYAYDDAGRMTTATLLSSTCLGSTMAVVDASGTVQDSYNYDVYGTPSKTGKQKRWKNNQKGLNDLWGRFEHLDCANHIGTGWVPNDFDEQLSGEYPKFDASSKSWWNKLPDVDLEWPEVPEGIWWNDDDWWNPPIPVPAPGPVSAY